MSSSENGGDKHSSKKEWDKLRDEMLAKLPKEEQDMFRAAKLDVNPEDDWDVIPNEDWDAMLEKKWAEVAEENWNFSPAVAVSLSTDIEIQKQYVGAPADAKGEVIEYRRAGYKGKGLKGYSIVFLGISVPKPADDFYPWPYYLEASSAPALQGIAATMTSIWNPRGDDKPLKLPLEIYSCFQLWRQLVIPHGAFALGELRWQPNVGFHSLIEVLDPVKVKQQDISKAWRGLKMLQALKQRGRQFGSGRFSSASDLETAITETIKTMRRDQPKIYQREVALEIGYDPKYFSELLRQQGLNWNNLKNRK